MDKQKTYRIIAKCDPYHAKTHYKKGSEVIKYNGPTPIVWVNDDNGGDGYTLSEAHKELDGYAASLGDEFRHEDNDSIKDLIDEIARDAEVSTEVAQQSVRWYKGPGVYCGNELYYVSGSDYLINDVITYSIDEMPLYEYIILDTQSGGYIGGVYSTESAADAEIIRNENEDKANNDFYIGRYKVEKVRK